MSKLSYTYTYLYIINYDTPTGYHLNYMRLEYTITFLKNLTKKQFFVIKCYYTHWYSYTPFNFLLKKLWGPSGEAVTNGTSIYSVRRKLATRAGPRGRNKNISRF